MKRTSVKDGLVRVLQEMFTHSSFSGGRLALVGKGQGELRMEEYARRLIDALGRINAGETRVTCPKCGRGNIRFSYTHFGDNWYGTWLECDTCDMVEAAHGQGRPPRFQEDLINPKFQRLDEKVWASNHPELGKPFPDES